MFGFPANITKQVGTSVKILNATLHDQKLSIMHHR